MAAPHGQSTSVNSIAKSKQRNSKVPRCCHCGSTGKCLRCLCVSDHYCVPGRTVTWAIDHPGSCQ